MNPLFSFNRPYLREIAVAKSQRLKANSAELEI